MPEIIQFLNIIDRIFWRLWRFYT